MVQILNPFRKNQAQTQVDTSAGIVNPFASSKKVAPVQVRKPVGAGKFFARSVGETIGLLEPKGQKTKVSIGDFLKEINPAIVNTSFRFAEIPIKVGVSLFNIPKTLLTEKPEKKPITVPTPLPKFLQKEVSLGERIEIPTFAKDVERNIERGVDPLIAAISSGSEAMLDVAILTGFAKGLKAKLTSPTSKIKPNAQAIKEARVTLGVSKNATPEQIKTAYLTKAKQFHPDKLGVDRSLKFNAINDANQLLTGIKPTTVRISRVQTFRDKIINKLTPKPKSSQGVITPFTGKQVVPSGALARTIPGVLKPTVPAVPAIIPGQPQITPRVAPESLRVQPGGLTTSLPPVLSALRAPKTPFVPPQRADVALRETLRAEQRGARAGFAKGSRITRDTLLKNFRVTQKNIQGLKKQVVEFAKELPLNERGKFLPAIKNVKTQAQLVKVFARIDKVVDSVKKGTAIKEIKKTITAVQKSPSIDVTYKKLVNEAVADLEFGGKTQKTLNRLLETEKFIQRQVARGQEVNVPIRILKELQVLNRGSIKDLSLQKLEVLSDKIKHLQQLGATKQRAKDEIYNLEKQRIQDEVVASVVPIENNPLFQPALGEKIDLHNKLKNVYRNLLNLAQEKGKALTPMDPIFDMLDGANGSYDGSVYRNYKARMDINHNNYLNLKDELLLKVNDFVEKNKITVESLERIRVVLARNQVDGRQKLNNTGITDKVIDAINLTPKEETLRALMRTEIDKPRELVARYLQEVYNKALTFVEEYFPMTTDFTLLEDSHVSDRFGHFADEFVAKTKTVEKGFTVERTGAGKQPLKLNALEIFNNHMDNVAYLLSMGRDTKMLFEIANSPDFRATAGNVGSKLVLEWMDLIARKGGVENSSTIRWLDVIRKNTVIGVLGFKLSSMVIQLTALGDGAALIGQHAFKGLQNISTNPEIDAFVLKNMPELRARVGDDPVIQEISKTKTGRAALFLLKKMDGWIAKGVGWGAYMKNMTKRGLNPYNLSNPDPQALEFAQRIVRLSQGSSLFKDAPGAVSAGKLTGNKSIDKTILTFQNFLLGRWSNFYYNGLKTGLFSKKNIGPNPFANSARGKGAQIVLWLTIVTMAAVAERRGLRAIIRFLTGNENKEQDSFVKDVVQEAVSNVPVVGPIASSITYDSFPVPIIQSAQNIISGAGRIAGAKSGKAKTRGLVQLLGGFGAVAGIPGSIQTEEFLRNFLADPRSSKSGSSSGFKSGGGGPKINNPFSK